jgi:hypothetical protein
MKVKYDEDLLEKYGFGITTQNMDENELKCFAIGYYKGMVQDLEYKNGILISLYVGTIFCGLLMWLMINVLDYLGGL